MRISTSVAIIENLRRLALLNRDLDAGTIQDLFEGPSATSGTLSFHDDDPQCNATLLRDEGYPALYHACGNFTGLHIVDDVARFNYSGPKNEPIEIYVR